MSISEFAPPFYYGSPVLSTVPDQYQVAIESHGYIIDPKEYHRSFLTQQRAVFQDASDEPGEHCVDEETEILTSVGWKTHADLVVGDEVLTLNVETGLSEWQPVLEVFRYERENLPMRSMEGKVHSSLTTFGHRWPVRTKNCYPAWKTTATLKTGDAILRGASCADLPSVAKWDDDFVELVAWTWTEGNYTMSWKGDRVRRVSVAQHPGPNPGKVARIRACLTRLLGPPRKGDTWYEYLNPHNGCIHFQINPVMVPDLFVVAPDKVVSCEFIAQLTRAQLELFIEASVLGDGTRNGNGVMLAQKYRDMLHAFQMACILSGRVTNLTYSPQTKTNAHWKVSASFASPFMWAMQNANDAVRSPQGPDQRRSKTFTVEDVEYTGVVWCPRTENQTWMARRDGSVYFTGNSLNPEAAWRRSVSDWSHGAGQSFLDAQNQSDRLRFHASKNMDPWTPHQLQLLPATLRRKASVSGTALVKMVSGVDSTRGVYVLDSDGATDRVWRTPDPTVVSPSWTQCTGLSGQCWDIATDGTNVYVVAGAAGATKIYSAAMTTTVFAALTGVAAAYTGVAYANGRLFAWKSDGSIVEITAGGTETAIFTHRLGASFTWVTVIGAPNATYLCGSVGNNTEIYRVDVKDATGALSAPILAAAILGEAVTAAGYEGGLVILGLSVLGGTGGNVRVAQIGTTGALTMGPLVTSTLPAPVRCIDPAGRYVYFGWSNYDTVSTGLGRMDLAVFTSLLVPAYASDVMAGHTDATVQGTVTSTAVFGGTRLFTVTGQGIWGEGDATGGYTQTGTLTSGRIRYGMLDYKSFTSLDLRLDALPSGCELVVSATFDDGSVSTMFDTTTAGQTGPAGPAAMPRSVHEWCEITITVSAPATTAVGSGPVFRWWLLRAVPFTGAVEQIIVPIILRTSVKSTASEDAPVLQFDPVAELEFLRGLVTSRQLVTYQEGDRVQDVYVHNIEQKPDRWSWNQRSFEGLVLAELRSLA